MFINTYVATQPPAWHEAYLVDNLYIDLQQTKLK